MCERLVVALLMGVLGVAPLGAQAPTPDALSPAPNEGFRVGQSEWMIGAGPAQGVEVFHSVAGHRYVLQTISWGKVLTRPRGPGILRGQFEWAIEIVPIFGQHAPARNLGAGLTPIAWRWNFAHGGRVAPFAELAGGALWTRHPVPEGTTASNFTAHVAYGVRYFFRRGTAFVASYRFHHISNGNRLDRNPGVNAHVLQLGVSLMRGR